MKEAFHEDFLSEHSDPLDARTADFDWEEIFRRCDGVRDQLGDERFAELAAGFVALVSHIIGDTPIQRGADKRIGRRFLAFAWVINPSLIEGSPSLSSIARALGVHKVTLSVHSAQAARDFGIRNRAQSHGWNFKQETEEKIP